MDKNIKQAFEERGMIINVVVDPKTGKQKFFWYIPDTKFEGTTIQTADELPIVFDVVNGNLFVSDVE